MPPNRIRVLLLCEDRRQQSFFVHVCRRIGGQAPRVVIAPQGKGAAEAWVRQSYPQEVKALRAKGGERVALLVAVDGDRFGVAVRKRALEEALSSAGLDNRAPSDPIAVCVPTWSIETWLLYLCGDTSVLETQSYKSAYNTADREGKASPRSAATRFVEDTGPCGLPSLADGKAELRRLSRER